MYAGTVVIVEIIQLMLAPAVMVSACALLLLGMNNAYSLVANRTRSLTEERREILARTGERDLAPEEKVRLASISRQIGALLGRFRLVRNAVLSFAGGTACFVTSSLLLGARAASGMPALGAGAVAAFLLGLVAVLAGVVFAAIEAKRGYDIVRFEVERE